MRSLIAHLRVWLALRTARPRAYVPPEPRYDEARAWLHARGIYRVKGVYGAPV